MFLFVNVSTSNSLKKGLAKSLQWRSGKLLCKKYQMDLFWIVERHQRVLRCMRITEFVGGKTILNIYKITDSTNG